MATPTTPPTIDVPAALADAARAALHAPSVLNTQPWRWVITGGALELHADPDRQLTVADPAGRLLTLSCGAALHHARVVLTAGGHEVTVDRHPEPARPRLLARIRLTGRRTPQVAEHALLAAIPRRRTDRRAFGDTPVDPILLDRLRDAAAAEGAGLHVVRGDQMPMLAVVTAQAAATELADPAYRAELTRWTHRPPWSGDGVPATTAVRQVPRRVPVRDHTLGGTPGLGVGVGRDSGASFAVLHGTDDDPAGWLRGGEALSAVLLTAVACGLSTAPLSDAIEVAWPRRLLRDLLAGQGEPYLALRIGYTAAADGLPPVPRRDPVEVIAHGTDDAAEAAGRTGTDDRAAGHEGGV
ncbi:nitroreductase [Micromonospora sp. CPCC 206060]|uniref:Acg family FMN-binding oxidoreductase n=1 Tax=Micromonospora sp. CPCC 206060 TaxID=3122406 RepID=UPI002FF1BD30